MGASRTSFRVINPIAIRVLRVVETNYYYPQQASNIYTLPLCGVIVRVNLFHNKTISVLGVLSAPLKQFYMKDNGMTR